MRFFYSFFFGLIAIAALVCKHGVTAKGERAAISLVYFFVLLFISMFSFLLIYAHQLQSMVFPPSIKKTSLFRLSFIHLLRAIFYITYVTASYKLLVDFSF